MKTLLEEWLRFVHVGRFSGGHHEEWISGQNVTGDDDIGIVRAHVSVAIRASNSAKKCASQTAPSLQSKSDTMHRHLCYSLHALVPDDAEQGDVSLGLFVQAVLEHADTLFSDGDACLLCIASARPAEREWLCELHFAPSDCDPQSLVLSLTPRE